MVFEHQSTVIAVEILHTLRLSLNDCVRQEDTASCSTVTLDLRLASIYNTIYTILAGLKFSLFSPCLALIQAWLALI